MNYNDDYYDDYAVPATVRVKGDTYPVKDQLRAIGCHWNDAAHGWFAPVGAVADKAFAIMNANAAEHPAPAPTQAAPTTGAHLGTVGEKLTVEAVVETVREFETEFNRKKVIQTMAILRTPEGALLKWTSSAMPVEVKEGETITITGAVKAHAQYKGERQTVLVRCKVAGAVKLVPTHRIVLFCDAKSAADQIAVCAESGEVLEYGSAGLGRPADGDNTDHELAAALRGFQIANQARNAAKLDCLALMLRFDAQWMKGMVGKAKPLRDYARANKLIVKMEWIEGASNPADEWTTATGSKTVSDAELSSLALPIAATLEPQPA